MTTAVNISWEFIHDTASYSSARGPLAIVFKAFEGASKNWGGGTIK
jgi:hypothetical protein